MGKRNKKKRRLSSEGDCSTAGGASPTDAPPTKKQEANDRVNPLLREQTAFLESLTETERNSYFSNKHVDPDRRAEIWARQADVGSELVNKYSWATPDHRALRILKHFSPIVEIGCGANAYWCQQMLQEGIDVVGYDRDTEGGGRMRDEESKSDVDFAVKRGGPEVLSHKKNAGRTLFLCYPDEDDEERNADDDEAPFSMGTACLKHYRGDFVIHVGELFHDTSLSMEQAPWGRSSSPEFQESLATNFHCILHIRLLTNWLHSRDSLSVWKRSETCTLLFAAEDEDDQDEEVHYRHVPIEDRLPTDAVAPCLQHLLAMPGDVASRATRSEPKEKLSRAPTQGSQSEKRENSKSGRLFSPAKTITTSANTSASDYECPW